MPRAEIAQDHEREAAPREALAAVGALAADADGIELFCIKDVVHSAEKRSGRDLAAVFARQGTRCELHFLAPRGTLEVERFIASMNPSERVGCAKTVPAMSCVVRPARRLNATRWISSVACGPTIKPPKILWVPESERTIQKPSVSPSIIALELAAK